MTKGKALTLAAFTLWPFLYMIFFISIIMFGIYGKSGPNMQMIFPLHLFTMLEILILMVIYITNVYNNHRVPYDKRTLWVVILFLGNLYAMPVYWYLYIWKKHRDYD
jgi:hypothetical protein